MFEIQKKVGWRTSVHVFKRHGRGGRTTPAVQEKHYLLYPGKRYKCHSDSLRCLTGCRDEYLFLGWEKELAEWVWVWGREQNTVICPNCRELRLHSDIWFQLGSEMWKRGWRNERSAIFLLPWTHLHPQWEL